LVNGHGRCDMYTMGAEWQLCVYNRTIWQSEAVDCNTHFHWELRGNVEIESMSVSVYRNLEAFELSNLQTIKPLYYWAAPRAALHEVRDWILEECRWTRAQLETKKIVALASKATCLALKILASNPSMYVVRICHCIIHQPQDNLSMTPEDLSVHPCLRFELVLT